MLKTVLTALQNILTLARDLEESRRDIRDLNEKLYKLASIVQSLSDKIDANAQQESTERKALILQLQNELLKSGVQVHSLTAKKNTRSKKRTKK
jgi:hypothetical protein